MSQIDKIVYFLIIIWFWLLIIILYSFLFSYVITYIYMILKVRMLYVYELLIFSFNINYFMELYFFFCSVLFRISFLTTCMFFMKSLWHFSLKESLVKKYIN